MRTRSRPGASAGEPVGRLHVAPDRSVMPISTLSGLDVDPVYGPSEDADDPRFERIGWPGEYPFTRGLYTSGYRGRAWTIRQFAGFGNAQQTNERYKMILRSGAAACRSRSTCRR